MCQACLSRRSVLAALSASLLAACSENAASGRKQLAFVPDEMLQGLADESWAALTAKVPVSRDPAMTARLARIAAPITRAVGRGDINWRFAVLDSPELNALVLPNGNVGVFRGMMDFAGADDELASVVGHEAAHVVARHAAERVSQQLALEAGVSLATAILSGENGENADLIAGALGAGATFGVLLPYSRNHELEADRIGVDLMRDAGFQPAAALRFWERMALDTQRAAQPPEVLSTHPADQRRLEALRTAVEGGA